MPPWALPAAMVGGTLVLMLAGIVALSLRQGGTPPEPLASTAGPEPTREASAPQESKPVAVQHVPEPPATTPPRPEREPAGEPPRPIEPPTVPTQAPVADRPAAHESGAQTARPEPVRAPAPPRRQATEIAARTPSPEPTPAPPRREESPSTEGAVKSQAPQRGPGRTQARPPMGQPYGIGQGPGITVAARGECRLYLNGEPLAVVTKAGTPQFVPKTFLPGKNIVAVVGSKGADAPGVLVQIDELEKPYVSGPGWKVTSAPSGDWKARNFDDSGWEDATMIGDLKSRPVTGLDGAVLEPSAHWIWSARPTDAQVALRFSFMIRAEGFAQDVTGGDGGRIVVPRTADEFVQQLTSPDSLIILLPEGTYDFRQKRKAMAAANPNNPKDPSKGVNLRMVIGEGIGRDPGAKMVEVGRWDRRILVKGDKTIHGLGRGAFLRGASMTVSNARNVIFRNLCVFDVNPHVIEAGDGISGDNTEGLWVDHCTFRWISDGCDLSGDRGCRGVTFSWVHYNGANRWTIAGRQHFASMALNSEVTYHHVWWESVNGRAPKVAKERSRVHVYNNYYTDNDFHEVASDEGAQVLLEGCYFDGVKIPTMRETGGLIRSRDNVFKNITWSHFLDKKPGPEPKDDVFTPPYRYTLSPTAAVPALLRSRAGVGGRWGFEPVYEDRGSTR